MSVLDTPLLTPRYRVGGSEQGRRGNGNRLESMPPLGEGTGAGSGPAMVATEKPFRNLLWALTLLTAVIGGPSDSEKGVDSDP